MAKRRQDIEEYVQATATARAVRADVAEQLRQLVVESDRMSSGGEVSERIQLLVEIRRRIAQAHGQEIQARDVGLPLAPSLKAQREQRELFREAVMGLAVACGQWVAAMDYERAKRDERMGGSGDDD